MNTDDMIRQTKFQFPDLTRDEEDMIRASAETGGNLFLRCEFSGNELDSGITIVGGEFQIRPNRTS